MSDLQKHTAQERLQPRQGCHLDKNSDKLKNMKNNMLVKV